jgi:hypothetical protein
MTRRFEKMWDGAGFIVPTQKVQREVGSREHKSLSPKAVTSEALVS